MVNTKVRSFLKWPGNKFQCLEKIIAALPSGARLIEPFIGSGVVFLNTNYPQYLLADSNPDLISLFTCLQKEGERFIDYCAKYFANNNYEEKYYEYRESFNKSPRLRRRAALFLYLNRHGYNGLCRYNQQGGFNVPFGSYEKPYFPREEMNFFYEKAQRIGGFITSDFRATFLQAKPGDVIYCDPPYVPLSSSAKFCSYTTKNFTVNDQEALAELAIDAAKRNITVVISNHDTPFTRTLYEQGEIISFPVFRNISAKIAGRKMVQELLAIFKPR